MSRCTKAILYKDNLKYNLEQIRKYVEPETKICVAVKADGYGHNAILTALGSKVESSDGTTYTGIAFPDSKYYNLYTGSSYTGHALTETKNWYSDYADFVVSDTPWFRRGGYFNSSASAGVFDFEFDSGDSLGTYSSRSVISNK